MIGRAVDEEIGGGFPFPGQLGTNAAVIRHQRVVRQSREIGAHARIERVRALRIDVVLLALDPFDVRTEAHAPGHVERHMRAKPALDRRRIDQV